MPRRPKKPWRRKSTGRWYIQLDGKQIDLGPDEEKAHELFELHLLERNACTHSPFLHQLAEHVRSIREEMNETGPALVMIAEYLSQGLPPSNCLIARMAELQSALDEREQK